MNSRKEERLPVKVPTLISGHSLQSEGVVTDLSLGGCQVHCAQPVAVGTPLFLNLTLPNSERPVEIELGHVQWSHGREFGLRSIIVSADNRDRLKRFLELTQVEIGRLARVPGNGQGTSPASSWAGPAAPPGATQASELPEIQGAASALEITLGDMMGFLNWMLDAQRALGKGALLPPAPRIEGAKLQSCIEFVQRLDERRQITEAQQALSVRTVHMREGEVSRLLLGLHDNLAALYENLGRPEKADEIRKLASAIAAL